ncbi:molybdopterin-containing oxidoreductase family protein [Bauldia litoralis]|uniref:Anaerobic selenocysteine-containing dehydrogenase n=1 Tax=Bauldia litoralis TaxID=665467 RepID=A0A1G6DLE5_9HYPH|nr:molybdopterin oxidoreductase family protein [Bauldia litoralis]SDB45931.1 Anaerobic selenocysteine-containing dehydrogenase [Bauldia litoralis]
MNRPLPTPIGHSACPHDCPSTCALEVDLIDGGIGRVRGSKDLDYTAGVICAKVARYAERIHNPNRLLHPLRRKGEKGNPDWRDASAWERIGWDEALDIVAQAFLDAEAKDGAEAVWPYHYAGTMGLVQRDGIHRLRHAKRYSRQFDTICTNPAWAGYAAGTGRLAGPDPREMARSDLVVIWGTNAVATQINVMTHAIKARKERGARIAVIDVYRNETMKQADIALCLRPGTDAALACAVMHVCFRDGHADRDYLARYTDCPEELEAHLATRTPEWAAEITGLGVDEIEAFALAVGTTKRTYFRLGYGFTRSRNGAVSMHAASSIAAVTGAWQHEGGGAFHTNGAIFNLDKSLIEGHDRLDPSVRRLDQSRIGAILCGEPEVLFGGPPVTAMLIQNTNPMSVAPEQDKVRAGFARDDLFVCVHEQVMTETAAMADIVLPATMFLEHDDIYRGGGHQHILLGPKLVEPPGECRTNHAVFAGLADRLGVDHPGFGMSEREHIDWMLQKSGRGTLADLETAKWIDCQPDFRTSHFLDGFGHADGKFHFRPDWPRVDAPNNGPMGPWQGLPELPDHCTVIEEADGAHPFRLATSPARSFLNSSFNETPSSRAKEGGRPEVMIHPEDAAGHGIADGGLVRLGNRRGAVTLHARLFDGVRRGVLVSEGVWPNAAFADGKGINTLTGADPVAPFGGAAFHDNRVWIEAVAPA